MDSLNNAASLDTDNYLQRDVDSLSEAMLLSTWSDIRRNPHDEVTTCLSHQLIIGRRNNERMLKSGRR